MKHAVGVFDWIQCAAGDFCAWSGLKEAHLRLFAISIMQRLDPEHQWQATRCRRFLLVLRVVELVKVVWRIHMNNRLLKQKCFGTGKMWGSPWEKVDAAVQKRKYFIDNVSLKRCTKPGREKYGKCDGWG
jgi:hypothetical protein